MVLGEHEGEADGEDGDGGGAGPLAGPIAAHHGEVVDAALDDGDSPLVIIDAGVHGDDGGGGGEEVGGHHRGRREVAVLNQVSWGEGEVRVKGEVRVRLG